MRLNPARCTPRRGDRGSRRSQGFGSSQVKENISQPRGASAALGSAVLSTAVTKQRN